MERTGRRKGCQKEAGRILILEGEEINRQFTQRALGTLGYEVSCVANGAEAICFYRIAMERGHHFEAVILPLEPSDDLGGLEIFEQLRLLDPGVRAIVSSADGEHPVMVECHRYGFRNCLRWPYGEEDLAAALKGL